MTRNTTRRDFLKRGSALGAGFFVSQSAAPLHARNWPSERINVACIGVGGRGYGDLKGVAGENIVALCDVDENRADKAFKEFPKAKKHQDFRKMLDGQKDIEAITVATPDHTHATAAAMGLRLGKHVYCEKPLTHSIHEARVLTQLAAKYPRLKTQMGNQGHSLDQRRQIVEILQGGVIGKVTEVHTWTNRPIWPQAIPRPRKADDIPETLNWDLWLGPAPDRPYSAKYLPFKWRGWWDFGTGALGDMACHVMDAAYWGLKLGYPTHVKVEGDPLLSDSGPRWMTVTQTFPARGDLPEVKVVWYDGKTVKGPNLPSSELVGGQKVPPNGNIFVGEKGTLFALDAQGQRFKLLPEDREWVLPEPSIPRVPGSINGHHGEWLDAIKGKKENLGGFAYSGPFTEMVLIGIAAFRAETELDWDGPNMKARNTDKVDPFIRREYRKGWEL